MSQLAMEQRAIHIDQLARRVAKHVSTVTANPSNMDAYCRAVKQLELLNYHFNAWQVRLDPASL